MPDRRLDETPLATVDARPARVDLVQDLVHPEHVGAWLRRVREERAVPLEDVAQRTRIKIEFLRAVEDNRTDALPAEVFVRGFVRAYAAAIRADAGELQRRLAAREAKQPEPAAEPLPVDNETFDAGRRRFGVVLVVLVILIAATLTVSLLLRRPGPTAGGLSQAEAGATLRA